MDEYLTMAQVAAIKGVHVATVHAWALKGWLNLTRANMPRETTRALLDAMEPPPKPGRKKWLTPAHCLAPALAREPAVGEVHL